MTFDYSRDFYVFHIERFYMISLSGFLNGNEREKNISKTQRSLQYHWPAYQ